MKLLTVSTIYIVHRYNEHRRNKSGFGGGGGGGGGGGSQIKIDTIQHLELQKLDRRLMFIISFLDLRGFVSI